MGNNRATSTRGITDTKKESIIEKIFRILALLLLIICPLFIIFCFRVVKQYKRAVILRFGKVRSDSPAGPGIIWTIPFTDSVVFIDLRTQSYNLPSQEILTKDSVTVLVEAVAYFHVQHPLQCFLNVERYVLATQLLSVAILRHTMGQHTLTDLLSSRAYISDSARLEIDQVTMQWGVEMERVEIKDIILPHELQKAMAAEAEGTRLGKAKIIEAEGEIQAAVNLRDAARIMTENPQIMLLRYLQTLNFIASESFNTVVFPFPMEIPDPQECKAK